MFGNVNTFNPVKIAFHEWANLTKDVSKAGSIKNALKYLVNPPGWSHNGTSKTTRQLRKEEGNKI